MAHAVAFPDALSKVSEPDGQRSIIVDRVDLENIERSVQRVMKQWKATAVFRKRNVGTSSTALCLPPCSQSSSRPRSRLPLRRGCSARPASRWRSRKVKRLCTTNFSALSEWLSSAEGGTGKTVLATERAKRLVETGMSTLLLCHRATGSWHSSGHRSRRQPEPRLKLDAPSDLTVAAFTELVTAMAEKMGREYHAPHGRDLPDWMLSAVEDLGCTSTPSSLTRPKNSRRASSMPSSSADHPDEGPFYLFADPFQHSAAFSSGRGRASKGRYNWISPKASR